MRKAKIVLFTSNGINGNIVHSHLIKHHLVVGVVLDSPTSKLKMVKRRIKRLGLLKVFLQLLFMKGIVPLLKIESKKRQKELLSTFDMNSIDKSKSVLKPPSINSTIVVEYVNQKKPDLVMVCGTRLIQKKIIEQINVPMFNMHVGITPKYRGVHGGYWALVNKDLKHCGVTVHLVDPGIDTGGVISQKSIVPTKKDNYATYPQVQVIKGLECILEAIQEVLEKRLTIKSNQLESKLYYHPTIFTYLFHRIYHGVK